jgi:hypothetical protein
MRQSEDAPLWDSVTQRFVNVLDFAFGCHHRKLSRVFTIDNHSYRVCCECGATFNYSLETMSVGAAGGFCRLRTSCSGPGGESGQLTCHVL